MKNVCWRASAALILLSGLKMSIRMMRSNPLSHKLGIVVKTFTAFLISNELYCIETFSGHSSSGGLPKILKKIKVVKYLFF